MWTHESRLNKKGFYLCIGMWTHEPRLNKKGFYLCIGMWTHEPKLKKKVISVLGCEPMNLD